MSTPEVSDLTPTVFSHQVRDMKVSSLLSEEERQALHIIYPGMPDTDLLNTYRDLRNKLLRTSEYENFVCLICALEETGETSTLALNLGAVFAFDRSRSALVIDCDDKVSVLDELCAREDDIGLIDFIENDMEDISSLIHESGIERLRIVPSGRSTETRTEALESIRMRDVIIELKNRYSNRYIFINAPSMRLSSEVQVLANVSDLVVFQLKANTVSEGQLEEAVEMIGADKVAGIVFRND